MNTAAIEPVAIDGTVVIEDPGDPRLADYRLLNDQAARRRLEGDEFFIAEGYVAIDRLIESGHTVRSVLLAPSRVERFGPHIGPLAAAGVPIYVMAKRMIADAVGFDLHRGVIASADRRPLATVEEITTRARRIAVLEGLNDAENLGAIARAARAFGIDALIVDPTCTDPYSRRTVRVSMGEVLGLPIARSDGPHAASTLPILHEAGFATWAMTPRSDARDVWTLPVPERLAVVLGAEGPGLVTATLDTSTTLVRIPIAPDVDSLNVGHACAVTFAALSRSEHS